MPPNSLRSLQYLYLVGEIERNVKKKSIHYAKQINFRMDQVEKDINLFKKQGKQTKMQIIIYKIMKLRRELKDCEKNKCDGAIVKSVVCCRGGKVGKKETGK